MSSSVRFYRPTCADAVHDVAVMNGIPVCDEFSVLQLAPNPYFSGFLPILAAAIIFGT